MVLDREDDSLWLVPASALSAELLTEITPRCVLWLTTLHNNPRAEPAQLQPIHPTDAVVALMGQTMDPGRYGQQALEVLSELAARCHCVKMRVGPLDTATRALEELIDHEPPTESWCTLGPQGQAEGDVPVVPSTVRSVLIGDRSVVHDSATGAIVALDEAGTSLWRAIHGDVPPGWPADLHRDPIAQPFINQLAVIGILHRSHDPEATSP